MTSLALRTPNGPATSTPDDSASPSAWLVLAFAISMLIVLTSFAKLNPAIDAQLLNDKRIFATGLGALVYWVTLRRLVARSDRTLRQMIGAALAVGIPGTALILVARELFDLFTSPDGSEGIARNVRWLLLWLGYYGAWVTGFLAVRLHRCAIIRSMGSPAAAVAVPTSMPTPAFEKRRSSDEADWLVDAIADELAGQTDMDRRALSYRLLERAGYERVYSELDPDGPRHNRRHDLALRLAARLQRQRA